MDATPQGSLDEELQRQIQKLADAERRARRRARWVGAAVAVLATAVFVLIAFGRPGDRSAEAGPVEGRLELAGPDLGQQSVLFDGGRCLSGAAEKFRGVSLATSDGAVGMQIHEDQVRGSWIWLQVADRRLRLDRSECRRLHIELEDLPAASGAVGYSGSLELECRLAQGQVSGELHFSDCR